MVGDGIGGTDGSAAAAVAGTGRRASDGISTGRRFTEIDEHVARRARARRIELGLSQTAVAKACGVRFQMVQKRERSAATGGNRLSADALWRLAGVLGVSVGWFFEGLPAAGGGGFPADEGCPE